MQEGLPHGGEYVVAYTGEHLYSPEAAARATAQQVSSLISPTELIRAHTSYKPVFVGLVSS